MSSSSSSSIEAPQPAVVIPIYNELDEVDKVKFLLSVANKCYTVQEKLEAHLEQFPNVELHEEKDLNTLTQIWLLNYKGMNKEIEDSDNFSLADQVFVVMCYLNACMHRDWSFSPPPLEAMHQIHDAVRWVGVQHTPLTTFTKPSTETLQTLYKLVSQIITFRLYQLTPEVDKSTIQTAPLKPGIEHLIRLVPQLCEVKYIPIEWDKNIHEAKDFGDAPRNSEGMLLKEPEYGEYWLGESGIQFVRQSSRILHALAFEDYIYNLYPDVTETGDENHKKIEIDMESITRFENWMIELSKIDASDDFGDNFRSFVFESLLPVNSRNYSMSRKNYASKSVAQSQFQWELNYDVGLKIYNAFGDQVRHIARDPKHTFYPWMCLFFFSNGLFQSEGVHFLKLFYIGSGGLFENYKRLATLDIEGRHREPFIVRLHRSFMIHYVDPIAKKGKWIRCESAIHAVLLWAHILIRDNDGEIYNGNRLTKWFQQNFLGRDRTQPDTNAMDEEQVYEDLGFIL